MNILIVDHVCHKRTKSFDFFCNLLRERFQVDVLYYDRHYSCKIPDDKLEWADTVVFLEFLPFRFSLGVPGKPCVFVPMYDNEWGSVGLWRRLSLLGMNVVSFSERVTRHARMCGLKKIIDVKFAPDPKKCLRAPGDPRVVALWERGSVTFDVVKRMFSPTQLDKVIIMRRVEEGADHDPISCQDMKTYNVEIHESGFIPEEQYREILSKAGVYIAPRLKEGIGMSFLEQMAMGKCVIAHDDATMNEYIVDGVNGLLVDMRNPRRIRSEEPVKVLGGVLSSMHKVIDGWEKDKIAILDFFAQVTADTPLRSPWTFGSLTWYMWYWFEGIWYRLKNT